MYNRINYGIHSICPYNILTGMPYGILKVLGGGTLTLSSDVEELFGGSNKFAWAVEAKTISAEWTATVKSLPDFLFELFMGASVSTTAASATGTVGGLTELNGNLVDATGIASVQAISGSEADLKAGKYIIKAVSSTTVDVYALTDIEFKKGSNPLSYINDALKITSSPLTIVSGNDVTIPNLGVEITGGAGTIGMTIGDTASFQVAAAHGGISEITIGNSATVFPEHAQLCLSQKRADGSIFELDLHKVIGTGFPIPMEEQAFSIPELAMRLVYSEDNDKVATIRAIKPV